MKNRKNNSKNGSIGRFSRKEANSRPGNTWVAFVASADGKRSTARMFSPELSRDQVRNEYYKEVGVRIQDTRARRLENY